MAITILNDKASTYASPTAYYTLNITPATSRTDTSVSFTFSASARLQYANSYNNYTLTMAISMNGGNSYTTLGTWTGLSGTSKVQIKKSRNSFTATGLTNTQTSISASNIKVRVTSSSGTASTLNATSSINSVTIPARTKYTITYNANGGSPTPSSQEKYHGTTLTLSDIIPTKKDAIFRNWNTALNGTGTSYKPGDSYTANSNTTLYAQWIVSTEVPPYIIHAPIKYIQNISVTSAAVLPAGVSGFDNKLSEHNPLKFTLLLESGIKCLEIYGLWYDPLNLPDIYTRNDLVDMGGKLLYTQFLDNQTIVEYTLALNDSTYAVFVEDGAYVLCFCCQNETGLWSYGYYLFDKNGALLYDKDANRLKAGVN